MQKWYSSKVLGRSQPGSQPSPTSEWIAVYQLTPHTNNYCYQCYEVASGVEYLHKCSPLVVHGDLKSVRSTISRLIEANKTSSQFNILIDDEGHAVITDFGLAKVKEEVSDVLPSSFFGGSTRWMAPELLVSQIEDEKRSSFTTYTDVYAFASVCLEVRSQVCLSVKGNAYIWVEDSNGRTPLC